MLRQTSTRLFFAATAARFSIYDFQVNGADHKPYDLSQHKGHPVLIYNVASQCGLAKSGYTTATELYNKYKNTGFTVLAFPCSDFANQEPGTEEEIKEFACTRFKAEFPIMEKVHVNGDETHPLYNYLKSAAPGLLGSTAVKWNFTSFLVDGEGNAVERFAPAASESTIEKKLLPLIEKSDKK